MGCFSGLLMSAASDQKLFCKLCSPFCCSFNEFVEEKVITPSYSSAILTPPPAILLFTAFDLTSISSHIHSWVLFLLWFHPFILSGVTSPLISGSILGIYRSGEFIFQCPIFLPFHTVHGVLKAMKWFAIPFSSGPHSVRPLHHDPSVLGGPT